MRLTRMTERIEFWDSESTQNEDGVMVPGGSLQFSCWAEVLNTPIREFKDATTKVGNRRKSPNFAIKFEMQRLIDSAWKVHWRGEVYRITGIDEDFDKRDLTKLECQAVDANDSDGS